MRHLTNVKLKAFLYISVAAASSLVMLLQHQHFLSCFGHCGSSRQSTNTAADDDDIQVLWDFVNTETCTETELASLLT